MSRSRKRWGLRRAGLALAVLLVGAAGTFAPRALRDVDGFRVRRVEVTGTRFLDAYTVVRAAGLDRNSNLFDDADRWGAGVMTLPLVADVTVRRRLPFTVAIAVREVEPLALMAVDELKPVDAAGQVVPLDPAGFVLDLPIVVGGEVRAGRVVGAGGQAALETLAAMRASAPELADRVSQVELREGAGLRFVFRDAGAEALLPLRPTDVQLTQLRLAYADLAARGELRKVRRIDLRFRDQVVVSFHSSPVS